MIAEIICLCSEVTNHKDWLDYLFQVLPSITGLFALYIAYKVYRNYDAKKIFVKSQIELVLQLVESLEKTFLILMSQRNGNEFTSNGFHVSSISLILMRREEEYQPVFGRPLFVQGDFFTRELFSFTDKMFLPQKIRKEISHFQLSSKYTFRTFTQEEVRQLSSYVILTARDKKSMEDVQTPPTPNFSFHQIDYPIYSDTDSFLESIIHLKKNIVDWLRYYGLDVNVEEI